MLFLTQGRQVMAAAEVPAQRRGHERIRDRKRGALDLWKLVGPHLTPGPYFVDHLGHLRHVLHGRWLTDVAKAKEASGAAGLPGALRRTLKWTVAAASPPTLLWLSRTEATRLGEGQLGVFALPTAGGNAVLLARDGTSIVRVYRGGTVSPSEARLRPILERHLRLTPAEIGRAHV